MGLLRSSVKMRLKLGKTEMEAGSFACDLSGKLHLCALSYV